MYAYVYQGYIHTYIHTYIQSNTNQVKGVLSPAKQARPSPFNSSRTWIGNGMNECHFPTHWLTYILTPCLDLIYWWFSNKTEHRDLNFGLLLPQPVSDSNWVSNTNRTDTHQSVSPSDRDWESTPSSQGLFLKIKATQLTYIIELLSQISCTHQPTSLCRTIHTKQRWKELELLIQQLCGNWVSKGGFPKYLLKYHLGTSGL